MRVHFQVVEGSRRRTQVFEGVVLKRQGSGVRETFTVRKQSFGVGVERTFPLHSPKIEKLEIAARGDVRRAKLYYLRGRIGKAARVAERRWGIDEEMISAPTAAVDAEGVAQVAEDEELEAAGPVADEESSSSQAAGDDPSSTPPTDEAPAEDQAEDAAPEEAPSDEAPAEEEQPAAEAEAEEAPSDETSEEPEAESDAEPEAAAEESGDSGDDKD